MNLSGPFPPPGPALSDTLPQALGRREERRIQMAYTCTNCGAVANAPGHLCNPCGDASKCSFCGTPEVSTTHVCKDKLAAMKFVCDGCGRVAMEEAHLCKPSTIA